MRRRRSHRHDRQTIHIEMIVNDRTAYVGCMNGNTDDLNFNDVNVDGICMVHMKLHVFSSLSVLCVCIMYISLHCNCMVVNDEVFILHTVP